MLSMQLLSQGNTSLPGSSDQMMVKIRYVSLEGDGETLKQSYRWLKVAGQLLN